MQELENLFLTELRQLYDAEHQLAGALAEMEKYASSKMLKLALLCQSGLKKFGTYTASFLQDSTAIWLTLIDDEPRPAGIEHGRAAADSAEFAFPVARLAG